MRLIGTVHDADVIRRISPKDLKGGFSAGIPRTRSSLIWAPPTRGRAQVPPRPSPAPGAEFAGSRGREERRASLSRKAGKRGLCL